MNGEGSVSGTPGELRVDATGYRALFEECAEAIVLYDAETRSVLDGNPAFLRLLGYGSHELRDLTIYDVVGQARDVADTNTERAIKWGASALGRHPWRRKDGAPVDVDVTTGKFRLGGRTVVFAIARAVAADEPASAREAKAQYPPGGRRRGHGRDAGAAPLSRRESQVLRLLAHGFSNRQIATRLKLSVKTVETFRARLYRKLGLRGRPALVRHALRTGMLNAEEPAADD